jgi:hypothetical protein
LNFILSITFNNLQSYWSYLEIRSLCENPRWHVDRVIPPTFGAGVPAERARPDELRESLARRLKTCPIGAILP